MAPARAKRLAQKAAAAADVEHLRPRKRRALGHKARAHGIEQMQRTKLPVRVPEARRERIELIKFAAIRVRPWPRP